MARTTRRTVSEGSSRQSRPEHGRSIDPEFVRVNLAEDKFGPRDEDWYTPKVFRLFPKIVTASIGRKGRNGIRCEIQEGEWQHESVNITFTMDKPTLPGSCYGIGVNEFTGSTTAEQLDDI